MAVVEGLIRREDDNTLSFGNYELGTKSKLSDFEFQGDLYKVKTFREITKLERNGMFVYESVPGTAVSHFKETDSEMEFSVEGLEDAEITLELEPEQEYQVYVGESLIGTMRTNLGGKLTIGVSLDAGREEAVRVTKA